MPPMGVRGYVSALPCIIKRQSEEKAFRIYITDSLQAITNNTSNFVVPGAGAVEHGAKINKRFEDILGNKPQKEEKQETAEDVINRITGNLMSMGG